MNQRIRAVLCAWVLQGATGCGDDECFSPTQNTAAAYAEGAEGCACEPARDVDVCVEGVALICGDEGRWLAVEDGPCAPAPDL